MTDTTATGTARVPTAHASRYLQQLCKHWQHHLEVEFTPEHGTIVFPREGRSGTWPDDGRATFDAHEDTLEIRIDGAVPEQVTALQEVIERHLDRFAFREAPLRYDWQ